MISYAGTKLKLPDDRLREWALPRLDWSWLAEATESTWPGTNLTGLAFPGRLPEGPIRLDVLRWPRGASRFASFHCLATDAQLSAIRAVVYVSGGYVSAPLVLADGTYSIATNLYLLPPRPLAQTGAPANLWLLTLVDSRFHWWFRTGEVAVAAGTTTWANLYGQIATLLGTNIVVDAVASAYPLPPAALSLSYEALPILLDSVAESAGQKIVRSLDGSVRAMNATSSQALLAFNLTLAPVAAGGVFQLFPG